MAETPESKGTCPYCAESISASALVCKTCRRDIALPMSLRSANKALEQRVQELEEEVARLQATAPVAPPATVEAQERTEPRPRVSIIDIVGIYVLLPILVLLAAHYLLIVRFDAKLIWLRIASIALPALCGWALARKASPRWYFVFALGVVVAFASVFGMSTVVHYVDGDPIMPASAVAWRETVEYSASIALSYLLGSVLVHAAQPFKLADRTRHKRKLDLAVKVARTIWGSAEGKTLGAKVESIEKLLTRAAARSEERRVGKECRSRWSPYH